MATSKNPDKNKKEKTGSKRLHGQHGSEFGLDYDTTFPEDHDAKNNMSGVFGSQFGKGSEADKSSIENTDVVTNTNVLEGADRVFEGAADLFKGSSKTAEGSSRVLEGGSKAAENASKTAENANKTLENSSRVLENSSKTLEGADETLKDGSKVIQKDRDGLH